MTQEDKNLLLRDLCARLPYKPICFKKITNCIPSDSVLLEEDIYSFRTGKPTIADYGQHDYYKTVVLELKPYLRPMSSMTSAEVLHYISLKESIVAIDDITYYFETYKSIDWLNAHHFDYRGLIEKGLALKALEGMYNTNNE
jgi:hypothetical protein